MSFYLNSISSHGFFKECKFCTEKNLIPQDEQISKIALVVFGLIAAYYLAKSFFFPKLPVVTLPNGTQIKGNMINGTLNGKGKVCLPSGTIFKGTFKNCKIIYSDGSFSEGEYIYHKLVNGSFYKGTFDKNGKLVKGLMTVKRQDHKTDYTGTFIDGKLHGEGQIMHYYGTYDIGQGFRSSGKFENGMLVEGSIVKGGFENCMLVEGSVHFGKFKNDILVNGSIHEGEFNRDGMLIMGSQTTLEQDGNEKTICTGTFKNGLLHGENCSITFSNGTVYRGSFENGKLVQNYDIQNFKDF